MKKTKKHNPFELTEEDKKMGLHQITIQEALENLRGGVIWHIL